MDVSGLNRGIGDAFKRRKVAIYALCLQFAARALNTFRQNQRDEKYWHNQTGVAMARVFSRAFQESDAVGWFMAHAVQYGPYLEIANDRKHEALRPILEELLPEFMRSLRELTGYSGGVTG
jgi:hypothetical protein